MQRTPQQIYTEFLVLYAQAGDRAALAQLLRDSIPLWQARARSILGSKTDAEDAVQDTCITVANSIGSLDDPAAYVSWANRILSRRCADIVRKIVRRRRAENNAPGARDDPPPDLPDAGAEASDEASNLRGAIDDLPPEQRLVVVMHYLEDKPLKQIARITQVPIGTLKSRLFAARQTLARALSPDHKPGSKP